MRIPILIFLFFFLFACKRNSPLFDGKSCSGNCYVLQGKVLDTASNIGLPGVALKFYFRQSGLSLLSDLTTYMGEAISDANGDYSFRFDGSNYKSGQGYYYTKATRSGYFFDPLGQNEVMVFTLDSSRFNIPLVQNFSLYLPSKLTVRFKATTVTNFESLTFAYHYGEAAYGLIPNNVMIIGSSIILNGGRAIDTTISFETAGNIKTFLQWSAGGNGVNISKNDTVLVTGGGNLPYLISL